MLKLGILISGRGSNLAAIISAIEQKTLPAKITLVICNTPNAKGIDTARAHGLSTTVILPKDYSSQAVYESAICSLLNYHQVDLVVLAGYMKIVGPILLTTYEGRMINIHPSLLPKYKGLHAQRQALDANEKIAGCTTHYVTQDLDGGPIIRQAEVPIFDTDTEDTLSARILESEHSLLIQTIHDIAKSHQKNPQ